MIRLMTFKGEAPRVAPRALPNEMSQTATNARLLSGDLGPWKDMSDLHTLGKAGASATNTIYLFAGQYWFSWLQTEVTTTGATQINVARVPIAGDTTYRTIFTGAGTPKITNKALAINPDVGPYGPYPDGWDELAVNPPADAPDVVNVPGTSNSTTTTTTFTDYSTWSFGWNGGGYGANPWQFFSSTGGPQHPFFNAPYLQGYYQSPNSNYATAPGQFSFASCSSFSLSLKIGPDVSNPDQAPNGYIAILSSGEGPPTYTPAGPGSLQGGLLYINFRDGNNITFTDIAGTNTPTMISTGTITQTDAVQVDITCTQNTLIGTVRTFQAAIKVTRLSDSVVIANTSLPVTYAGESTTFGGQDGTSVDSQYIFISPPTWVVTTPPSTFVPTFSNYTYTDLNALLLESSNSPVSTPPVQVDNDNTNYIIVPAQDASVVEVALYRSATGSTGTEFLQVENGSYPDGTFPICTCGGTANAITLADSQASGAPKDNTYYWFVAANTNTGDTTINLNATGDIEVLDYTGAPLAANAINAGGRYSVCYNQTIIQVSATSVLIGVNMIPLVDATGVSGGATVTDAAGAIPPGTIVSGISGNTITLSNAITSAMTSGNQLFFQNTTDTYTLQYVFDQTGSAIQTSGYIFRDTTATANLGPPLPSADWDTPPPDMINVIALPNQIIAGSSGNTLLLSVQGQPQAYPQSYRLATDTPIVALVALDANIAILTTGQPYTAYGTTPSAYQMTKETFVQGCVSARSASYLRGYGAVYASTDGIYAYGGLGQIRSLTEQLFTLQEWELLNPSTILGIVHQGLYFFWYDATEIGGSKGGFILDPNPNGFGLVPLDFHACAAALDTSDDTLYLVLDQGVINGGATTPTHNDLCVWEGASVYRPVTWKSKLWQLNYPTTYMLCRVRALAYTGLQLILYSNGTGFATLNPTNDEPFVIPAEVVKQFSFQLSGITNPVQTIEFVERVEELDQ